MDCSAPGFLVHHQLSELTQTHVHLVGDAIHPSHPLLSHSPTFSLSQHQGLFKWVSSSHQVAKVLEFQLQHQSFQWIFSTDFKFTLLKCTIHWFQYIHRVLQPSPLSVLEHFPHPEKRLYTHYQSLSSPNSPAPGTSNAVSVSGFACFG